MTNERTYSEFEVDAALCVWEWLLDMNVASHDATPESPTYSTFLTIRPLFENYGYGGMRMSAKQAGLIVAAAFIEYEKHVPDYDMSFDWDWVPMVCSYLNWEYLVDNNQYGDGKYTPDVEELVAIIIASQAHGLEAA